MACNNKLREHCPDCGVTIGEFHHEGCDIEPCPLCGLQYDGCDCKPSEVYAAERVRFAGYCAGEAECVEYGMFIKLLPDKSGHVSCSADDDGAYLDYNRLFEEGAWDAVNRKWLMPKE